MDILNYDREQVILFDRVKTCQMCGEKKMRSEMLFTKDYYGNLYHLVCPKCYRALMKKGYDGEAYSEYEERKVDY